MFYILILMGEIVLKSKSFIYTMKLDVNLTFLINLLEEKLFTMNICAKKHTFTKI